MKKVFIYLDNSNIFISAQETAAEREGESARARVRIHFRNLLALAHAGRPIERAIAVGSIPPELRQVWNRLENEDVEVQLLERGALHGSEQGVDQVLQTIMLRDTVDYNGVPGIAVLLTGDGSGFVDGVGFHADIERMHRRGWDIEVLSWRHSCNRRMREWAEEYGKFIALDDFYNSITFLEGAWPGQPVADPRYAEPLQLDLRP
ncbi:MAG: NYN domain-containing protein [Gemmatimonadota bacterium]|nr:NYN domain-containing protein [Gemmatimonadota bacterium]MDE2831343.1 NYN domain-containing protein [Gemmatimonadota bacterium]